MNGPEDSSNVPILRPVLRETAPAGSLGVLGYAQPVVQRVSRRTSPIWAKIAIPSAVGYAGMIFLVSIFAASWNVDRSPDAIYFPLLLTSPLGIAAFVTGVLGHYSPRGRLNAGPAVWIISCTPGIVSVIHLLVSYFGSGLSIRMLEAGGTIVGANALVVLALNGRILRASEIERKYDQGI